LRGGGSESIVDFTIPRCSAEQRTWGKETRRGGGGEDPVARGRPDRIKRKGRKKKARLRSRIFPAARKAREKKREPVVPKRSVGLYPFYFSFPRNGEKRRKKKRKKKRSVREGGRRGDEG